MTAAEARKLGLLDQPPPRRKTQRAALAKDTLPNRCATCDDQFTGETAERRHSDETGHRRFEAVL